MRTTAKIGAVVAAGALAIAVPAAADPAHPSHPSGTDPGKSHKCATHEVAYVAHGTIVSWSPTAPTGNGPYSGTVTVLVTKVNHHANKGSQPYTLTGAKVRFDQGTTSPATGDPVTLIGKIAVAPAAKKGCTTVTGTTAGTITITKVDVHALKS
jgi:hypothetical protein